MAVDFKKKLKQFPGAAARVIEAATSLATFEWFVRGKNGGGVVVARALAITTWVCLLGIAILNFTICEFGALESEFDRTAAAGQVRQFGPVFVAIFAGTYTALYARLSSQSTYLLGVYNQIKAAQCGQNGDNDYVADWKAGFIVDARALHLSNKPLFAATVSQWSSDPNVMGSLLGAELDDGHRKRITSWLFEAERAVAVSRKRDFWRILSEEDEQKIQRLVNERVKAGEAARR